MPDRTQPTPIDSDEYERFVQFVEDVHGGTRGHLRSEIENALREYRQSYYDDTDPIARIEDDVASIKSMLADADTDGGSRPSATSDHAPAQTGGQDKPAANQPRSAKVDWMVAQVDNDDGGEITRARLAERIRGWYGFDDDTIDWYIDRILDELDAKPIPQNSDVYAWGDKYAARVEAAQEAAEREAADRMDDLTD